VFKLGFEGLPMDNGRVNYVVLVVLLILISRMEAINILKLKKYMILLVMNRVRGLVLLHSHKHSNRGVGVEMLLRMPLNRSLVAREGDGSNLPLPSSSGCPC